MSAAVAAAPVLDVAELRQRVRELPALPQAAMEALTALRNPDTSSVACADLIARDAALTARVLRLANSAFYGVPGRVASVRDSVHLLGRRTLGSLITLTAVAGQFDSSRCPNFSFTGFWRHGIGVALASSAIARALERDEDAAFTVGLLHDIGYLVLATYAPEATAAALAQAHEADVRLADIEQLLLGITHLEVGAQVAAQWKFPPSVVQALAGHHAPAAVEGDKLSGADIVHVADAVVHALDLAGDAYESVPPLDAAAWERLGLPPRVWMQIFRDTEQGVIALCTAMGL